MTDAIATRDGYTREVAIAWTAKSGNTKTGPIPVSTTAASACPSACPLRGAGCYAEHGPLGINWRGVSSTQAGQRTPRGIVTMGWEGLVGKVRALPAGQLWRHNQAGDLPHHDQHVDAAAVARLVEANAGKRGFTYTHHAPEIGDNAATIRAANAAGFAVNLSANNLDHADQLAAIEIGPVVVVVPATVHGNVKIETPAGRRVVVCPATYRDDVTCSSCVLCARIDRNVIVAFPAHGAAKVAASLLAAGIAA